MSDGRTDAKRSVIGLKYDTGKPEYHHIPTESLEGIAKALTFGGKKYADYNFRAGIRLSRIFNASMRHLWAWWGGENNDKESGLSHLYHAGACIIMMIFIFENRREFDDRYKYE